MKRDSEGVMVNVGQPNRAVTSGWPLVNDLIRIDPPPIEVTIEVDTSRFDAAMATVDESLRRIKQVQAFAWWSMANDPTRRWDQRHQWIRR